MIRITAACLACLGILLSTCLPVRGAAPPAVSVLGNIDFLGPTQGWIEVSSSPYYTQSCQTELHPPAVCNRAVTDLFQTTNGGRTWTRRLRLAGRPLTPSGNLPQAWLHVFSPGTILALPFAATAGARGRLYRTFDGGGIWASSPVPSAVYSAGPTDVASSGPTHLWLLRHDGAAMGSEEVSVFRTANSGATWAKTACTTLPGEGAGCRTPSGLQLGGHKDNIVFGSPSRGLITESDASGVPSLYVTGDGGHHWLLTRPGLPRGVPGPDAKTRTYPYAQYQQPIVFGSFIILPTMATICSNPKGRSTACTSALYALLSFDGGRTWTASRHIPSGVDRFSAAPWQVMTPRTWWSVAGPRLWVTYDAGKHWHVTPLQLSGGRTLLQIQFVSRTTGWAIAGHTGRNDSYARNVTLLHTTDAGHSWTTISLPSVR